MTLNSDRSPAALANGSGAVAVIGVPTGNVMTGTPYDNGRARAGGCKIEIARTEDRSNGTHT